ncbi:hypothetical protein tinsulaeT_35350 [Thalassotalea insulae]|uniref:Tetratricopeptide repeat protein n=1 Tax=Thalassotalea insulae TaxID=2056778 RepID=A0ABQ6GZK4_9GAMM|nr:tetratricopeptide repeat-containing sulfotransferase family protein [Thalassotalea insulae]GLX80195.1 hypothetical protein tinsulaeT_35350 [Thalassotalea insulae]
MHTANISTIQRYVQQGQFKSALELAQQLLVQHSDNSDALYLAAVSCRYLTDYEQAISYLERLIMLSPGYGRGYQELAHVYRALNDQQKALEYYLKAVKCNPSLYASWLGVKEFSQDQEQLSTATNNLDYLKTLPKELISVSSFIAEDKLDKAEKLCRHFLMKQPKHVEAMRLLAKIAEQHHVLDDAEFLLKTCYQLAPNNRWVQFDYINVLHRRQKFELAYQKALALSESLPDDYTSLLTLANQEAAIGQYDSALEHYQYLMAQDRKNPVVPLLMGHVYKTIGDQGKAIDSYLAAITADNGLADAYWSLANLKTYSFVPEMIEKMQHVVKQPAVTQDDQVQLHFALGKAFENLKQFEQSFFHYQQGNTIKRQLINYDAGVMKHNFDLQQAFFSAERAQKLKASGHKANDAIFILGLPRTGSTLVEQILSSHSQIDGTLELPQILSYVQELNGRKFKHSDARYPKILAELSEKDIADFGARYLAETQVYRQGAPYFIDKMPNNFRHIGLIKSILPNAKIIDTRREPLSCCFSVFKQLFAEGQEFSYSFADIAAYYQGYQSLMEHWHQVYPGEIFTVNYETLVAESEQTIRDIFTYLELPVEASCFEFYKTDRAVRTASSEQVRQPINRKGLEQWQHFAPYLDELKALLA